jgi:hypothetical protein
MPPAKAEYVPVMRRRIYRAAEDHWYTEEELREKEGS